MSKYDAVWKFVHDRRTPLLTFDEIADIAGVPVDHSFLKYKKELLAYGFQVEKISMKEQTVRFSKLDSKS